MKNYQKLSILILASLMALSPAFAFAKENGRGEDAGKGHGVAQIHAQVRAQVGQRDDKSDGDSDDARSATSTEKEDRSCVRAFGHLFAPGFVKNFGNVDFFRECLPLPFGIAWRFHNGTTTPTSTPDRTAPVISNKSASMGTTTAEVAWNTDENADSKVYFGTSTPLDLSATTTSSVASSTLTKVHLLDIASLTASTTYYFVVQSTDASGNTATSSVFSGITK